MDLSNLPDRLAVATCACGNSKVNVNSIHPSAQLLGDVVLGTGNTIGPLAVIIGPVTIGEGNWIGTGAVVGAPPEVRSWEHPREAGAMSGAGVKIGNRNVIREHAQVHQGWKATTTIGNDAFIMNQAYVAHDCRLGNGVTLASSVLLAGHVVVGDFANLGLGATVHQGRWISHAAMIGMGSVVTRDVPPFAKAYGSPARVAGANTVGMQRLGVSDAIVSAVHDAYVSGRTVVAADIDGADPDIAEVFQRWSTRQDDQS